MIPAHELQVQAVHEECPAWECGSVRFARKVLLALNVRWHWSECSTNACCYLRFQVHRIPSGLQRQHGFIFLYIYRLGVCYKPTIFSANVYNLEGKELSHLRIFQISSEPNCEFQLHLNFVS